MPVYVLFHELAGLLCLYACTGADIGFQKGGVSGELLTKTRHFRAHTCNVFSFFMKFRGPPKKGGGGGGS